MKICLFSDGFLPGIGGAEIAIHNLAKTFNNMGHTPIVVAYNRKGLRKYNLPYKVETIPPIFYRLGLKTLIEKIAICHFQKKHNFDVINIHKAYVGYSVSKVKKKLKVPIVITGHGGDIQIDPDIGYGRRISSPKWARKITCAVKNADGLISISSNSSKCFLDIGADQANIYNIPNGVDLETFNRKVSLDRDLLGLSQNDKIILAVGTNYPVKGFDTLLKAISVIKDSVKDYKLIIVGKWTDRLLSTVKDLGIKDKVILLDEKKDDLKNSKSICFPSDFLLSIYQNADIFVSASRIEGFSLVCLEAMAAGLPMVLTRCFGNEDVFKKDGQGGFYVEIGDSEAMASKITKLLTDNQLRKQFSQFNRNYASEHYSLKVIASKYISLFEQLISERS